MTHCKPLIDAIAYTATFPMPEPYDAYSAILGHSDSGTLQFARMLLLVEDGIGQEWLSILGDGVEIIVRDRNGVPCPLDVVLALRALGSRQALEAVARVSLPHATDPTRQWNLVTMDLGFEAKRRGCDLLMCFACSRSPSKLTGEDEYAEVGIPLLRDWAANEDVQ